MFDEVKPKRVNKNKWKDLTGGPAVKTSPSNAGGAGLVPHLGAEIPHASWPKNRSIEVIV